MKENGEYESDSERVLLENGYDGIKFLTDYSYDTALIGVSDDGRAIYDYDLMVEWLMEEEEMSEEDAVEWLDYNTLRAIPYFGEGAPVVMHRLVE